MTAKFALVTDTTSDLPKELIEKYNIYMVPQIVIWGRESLREGIDIDSEAFFKRLSGSTELPTTSRPVPIDTVNLFKRAIEETGAEAIVMLSVSKEVSGTVSTVEEAMKEVDFPVYLLDTRTVSLGLGLITLKVAEARDEGATPQEALALAQRLMKDSTVLFTPSTLEYLYRGGRIGGASHLVGSALSIKPILALVNGTVNSVENVRTRKRAIKRMLELVGENLDPDKPLYMGVVQGNAIEEGAELAAIVKEIYNPDVFIESWIGASIGTHVGPGILGVMRVQ